MSLSSPEAVLLVGRKRIELLLDSAADREPPHWAVLQPADESPRALAAAVKAELARLGRSGEPLVLALEADMLESRRVALPPVPHRRRASIWARRAAGYLGCEPEDALYVSIPLSRGDERADEEGEPWMLHALRRSTLAALQLELRRAGHRVRRVVVARLALLARACQLLGEDSAPFLLVARERGANTLNLLRRGELIQQSILATDSGVSDQAMAVALVQELRHLSAYWRRMSRGEQLGRLLLMGFAEDVLEPLIAAIRAALGGVEIVCSPERGGPDPADHRLELLRACRVQGRLQADLCVPLPPRTSRTVAVALLLVALAAAAARPLAREGTRHLEGTRARVAALQTAGADLEELVRREAKHATAREELTGEVRHWVELLRENVPAESLLPELFDALAGRAELVALRARVEKEGVQVKLSGRTRGEPEQVFSTLDELRRDLLEGVRFAEVHVVPPARVPSSRESLDFTVTLRVEGE